MKIHNSKHTRAKRLARWLDRLIQLDLVPLYGWTFYHGVAIPVTHP